MKSGFEFIRRLQEDAEFRRQVHACSEGEERLAFLRSEGYDFAPFVRILDNLSSDRRPIEWCRQPGESAGPVKGASGFFGFFSRIFRSAKASRPDW